MSEAALPEGATELEKATAYWKTKYEASPQDLNAGLSYLRNLRAGGHDRAALAIAQQLSIFHGSNRELAGEYGRLAMKFGQVQLAARLLAAADDPTKPDWKILSARGAALAKLGDPVSAIPVLERARAVAPDQPSISNNLAMAYVAAGELTKAEDLLQTVALRPDATPRMRQNLALVLGLQGRYTEAKALAAQDGATQAAYERIEQLRAMNAGRGTTTNRLKTATNPTRTAIGRTASR